MTRADTVTAADEEVDGDVHISPVYAAGGRYTGDFAFRPLFDLGAERRHDADGNFFVNTADQRIRVGFIPEQDWDTLWKIAVHPGPFTEPLWVANFSEDTPTEVVTALTTELARMYRADDDSWLTERTVGVSEWMAPYTAAGWTTQPGRGGEVTALSPDGLADVTCRYRPLAPKDREQGGQDGRYTLGTTEARIGWYGRLSSGTPARILDAVATAMLDPAPVLRYHAEVGLHAKRIATITPIVPPLPSPLDVQRSLAAKARSATRILQAGPVLGSTSALAWTTSSPPRPAHHP